MKTAPGYDLILIHPSYNRRTFSGKIFPLGLGYISSAAVQKGYRTKIIDCAVAFESLSNESLEKLDGWISRKLQYFIPKLAIGIGPCTTSAVKSIRIIAKECKRLFPRIPIIYGGPLASIAGQEELFFSEFMADMVVKGDGEKPICNILNALRENESIEGIEGVATRDNINAQLNIENDLDKLDFPVRPDPKSWLAKQYRPSTRRNNFNGPFATMLISRGCPYTCSYCVSGALRNGNYHRRSWENVVQEINEIVYVTKSRSIIFYDDCFFPSEKSIEKDVIEFSILLKTINENISWQIEMRPNVFMALDRALIKELYKAGCHQINLGIETPKISTSLVLNKRFDPERLRNKCNQVSTIEPAIKLTGTFIFGGPDETKESINETITYSTTLNLLFAHYYPLELYPGTKLYQNYIRKSGKWWWYNKIMSDNLEWGEIVYENENINRAILLKSISQAYNTFYRRKNWVDLAKMALGDNFQIVEKHVSYWIDNRFRISVGE